MLCFMKILGKWKWKSLIKERELKEGELIEGL